MSEPIQTSVRGLLWTYLALMLLLFATWALSFIQMGTYDVVVSTIIALVKAVLVLLVFMELRSKSGLVNVFAGMGFYFLSLLIIIAMFDYLARGGYPYWLGG